MPPLSERDRLLRRIQADLAPVQAEVQSVQEQTRRYVEIEATRPLTADEAKQAGALQRQARTLHFRLRQLRAEFAQLQGSRRRPGKERRPG